LPVYMGNVVPWALNHINAVAYSGAGLLYAQTTNPVSSPQLDHFAYNLVLLSSYKIFEPQLASVSRMCTRDQFGPSLLHVTIYQPVTGGGNLIGAASRGPFTQRALFAMMRNISSISYDTAPYSLLWNANEPNYPMPNNQISSKEYDQRYTRQFSGCDSVSTIAAAFRYDDIVPPGTEASNITPEITVPALSPAHGVPKMENPHPLPLPPPNYGTPESKSYLTKLFQSAVPSYGNYCGPGLTAGSRDFVPVGPDGKYAIPPVDKVDAICKRHDEAYEHAGGDRSLRERADAEMVRELEHLGFTDKGAYGLVAQALFSLTSNSRRRPSTSSSSSSSKEL